MVNNAASGYVKALQHAMYEGSYQSSELSAVDYASVARALGCDGIAVDHPDDLRPALAASILGYAADRRRRPCHARPGQDAARHRHAHGGACGS